MSARRQRSPRNIQIPITEFAVPSPRVGHIEQDSGFGPVPMVGSEIHQEIQRQRLQAGGTYVIEKWMTHTFDSHPYKVTVTGRLDGMRFGANTEIEEIKSSYAPEALLKRLAETPHHPYLLQLRTYGYLHWLATGREPILKLLVVSARTRAVTEIEVPLDPADYEIWLKARLKELADNEKKFEAVRAKRTALAAKLKFPFAEPRPGQKELIALIESKLGTRSRLLLQAPTGLGKTAGVLFPALHESLSRGQKTIYVTAKNSQHAVAEDAVSRLEAAGSPVRSVTVHAKSKMCLKDVVACNPAHCEFARDYYTKLHNLGVVTKLNKRRRLDEAAFKEAGREFEVCPFELQLECLPRADVVICDYNYVFSPRNILGRLTQNGLSATTPPNLVIDEAHNLPDRARDYFSAELDLPRLRRLMEDSTFLPEPLWQKIRAAFLGLESAIEKIGAGERGPHAFSPENLDLAAAAGLALELQRDYLASDLGLKRNDPVLEFCHLVTGFAEAALQSGDNFLFTHTPGPAGGRLRVTCCDAAPALAERYSEFANVIAFSATLKPFAFFLNTLGLDPATAQTAEFKSPFPAENRKILIIPQISTKLRDREQNYGKVRDTVEKIASLKPGNYFVFFPSFDFLNRVAALVRLPDFRVLLQTRDMRRSEIESFIDKLNEPDTPTIIFAVQGGVFAEGVDYPGKMLIGAMIVGPALPTFDFEREGLRRYFDAKGGSGFDFAYTYPAMTRVVQSAGRVIRSASDRGLIVLMDSRFLAENYLNALPADWLEGGVESLKSRQILRDIEEFWSRHESR